MFSSSGHLGVRRAFKSASTCLVLRRSTWVDAGVTDPSRLLLRLMGMGRYDGEARRDHFRRAAGSVGTAGLRDLRILDGRATVRRVARLTARERILATASASPGVPVVAGTAAAILHGSMWFDPEFQIELLHDLKGSSRHGVGRTTRRYQISSSDVVEVDGVWATTPVRTAFDVGRIPPDWRGLGYLDALHRAIGFSLPTLFRYIENHAGWRHIRQLRAIAPLIDGSAESPAESWVRLLMLKGDLPTPELQIPIADEVGREFARADLGYRAEKIVIEYDGAEFHETPAQQAHDMARDAKLEALGWKVIRINAKRLFEEPWSILTEIERALHERGRY